MVDVPAESIRDLVVACVAELGGQRRFEDAAARAGAPVSRQTISKIVRGKHAGRFGEETLKAIAAVSGWSLEKVHDLADEPMPTGAFAAQLPRDVDQLDQTSRDVVIDVINSMLRLQRGATVTPMGEDRSASQQRPRAARRGTSEKGNDGDA